MLTPEILPALVGAISAIAIMVVRDVALNIVRERRIGQQHLLKLQIERAYAPMEYLIITLLRSEDPAQKASVAAEIGAILHQHSYLLSEHTTSAIYTLLDDEEEGAYLLERRFFIEFEELKRRYYRTWFVSSRERSRWGWLFQRCQRCEGGVCFSKPKLADR